MLKRGQITVFIIIAILIVVGVAAILYFKGYKPSNIHALPPGAEEFKVYMDGCLQDVLEEGIYTVSLQGGYYNDPERGVGFLGAKVPYYFYEYENTIPEIKIIEEQIELYIKDKFIICSELYESDYEISAKKVKSVDVQITDNKVSAYVEQPIILKKGDSATEVSQFREEIPIRLLQVYEDAGKIIALQEEDPYHICLTCIDDIRDKDIFVEGFAQENYEIVFQLTDYKSTVLDEPYKFYFAIKYKEYDCNSLPADIPEYVERDCEREHLEMIG